jgi:hypothetical protein
LQLRKLPPNLLERVKAYIEFLGVDREEFFKELLDDLTKELWPVQEKLRQGYQSKKPRSFGVLTSEVFKGLPGL